MRGGTLSNAYRMETCTTNYAEGLSTTPVRAWCIGGLLRISLHSSAALDSIQRGSHRVGSCVRLFSWHTYMSTTEQLIPNVGAGIPGSSPGNLGPKWVPQCGGGSRRNAETRM